ncbi:hypothetical protein [Moheibacter sediminis]|uniref:Uncharacterized protein n=1 Tax=Moheibacter sediminis TaxID=1434700 RepID=A0A1W1YA06_9FLAO|nr:hypothetical protein [Moheibacter sediminis]SMC32944.1 hypothetical protein SAMN06296427_101158 [Moheibacter sediminis]
MKLPITLIIIFLGFATTFAQSESETLEWLNTKKAEIRNIETITVSYYEGKLSIDSEMLHAYGNNGAFTKINWDTIKDIKADGNYTITIVSNSMYNGENSYIKLYISSDLTPKYYKALKHMAELKGAKLVNNNLFD